MKKAPLIVFLSIVKKETIKSMIFFPVDYVNPLVGTLNGVVLDFDMNTSSSMQRGKNVKDFPYSLSNENK